MTQITADRAYKPRSEAELRIALARLLKYEQRLRVPPDDADEDIVLSDCIDEVIELRQKVGALERQAQARQELQELEAS